MASFLQIFLLLATTSLFSRCLAQSSRKELKDKEFGQVLPSYSNHSGRVNPSNVVQLSWRPRVFLYRGLLADDECDRLISSAQYADERSSGDDYRSNATHGLFSEDNVIARIDERISAWTFLPKENSKPLQVMHCGLDKSDNSFDYSGNQSMMESNVPLIATVVLYLSNVPRGGAVLFPDTEEKSQFWSDCTKTSDILRPVKGNAILFFSMHPNASPDKSSSHGRCPVLEGEMWYATKFFYVRTITKKKLSFESDNGECTDEDNNCLGWAAIGECERNPVFMIGSPDYYGTCRKSCNVC